MRGAGLEERGAGNRAQGAEGGGGRLRLGKARGSRGDRIRGIFPSPEPKRPSGNRRETVGFHRSGACAPRVEAGGPGGSRTVRS